MNVKEFCEKYYVERNGTNCLKWDALDTRFGDPELISMWVADMEFKTPECVTDALKERIDHGIFGYSYVPDTYYQAVIDWEYNHHGYKIEKDWIRTSPGVVSALYWAVNMFTKENDSVIILTPVYYPFHNCVKDSNRNLITCDLNYDNGIYTINYDKFEENIIENNVKLFILCSPHNPAGRVWKEEELERLLEICEHHNVLVISDEIHQDLVFGEHKHIPTASIANGKYEDMVITAFASSKTFNLATCLTSTIVIKNEKLRNTWDEFTKIYNQVEVNIFGLTAVEAVLKGGEEWYQALKEVILHNYNTVVDEMKEFPDTYIAPLEGTYLLFMDLRKYIPLNQIKEFTQDKCRLAVDYGEWFGENWKGFIRLNLGTHPDIVLKAITNIKDNLRNIKNK
ncbi:pyridoxal phosphate-dependent aminotransferase [Romboutsia sp. CE17]|uniref:MalY/PatB family protein n=1 Tax=Romboutsia sp. CE17 TaxID=2724150 RepID=UPI001442A567|nr:MalY/PatB family protein [Romboutsia sp. CE17]QJA08640.1 pyridoxal phosphate-dependent aminotransferase [Romboutsia sp. CE17]